MRSRKVWFARQLALTGQDLGQWRVRRFIGQYRVIAHLPEKPVYAAEQKGPFPAEVLHYE